MGPLHLLSYAPPVSLYPRLASSIATPGTSHPLSLELVYLCALSVLYPTHFSTCPLLPVCLHCPSPSRLPTSLTDNSHRLPSLDFAPEHPPPKSNHVTHISGPSVASCHTQIRSKLYPEVFKALEGLPPAFLTASLSHYKRDSDPGPLHLLFPLPRMLFLGSFLSFRFQRRCHVPP